GVGTSTRVRLSVAADGTPAVSLADAGDQARVRMTVTPEGYGAIEFLDASGKVVHVLAPERDLEQTTRSESTMHGLIGKRKAVPGQRDALTTMPLDGTEAMPGCISYVVAHDPQDPDAIWITGVWDSAESHEASLSLPEVRAAIARGRPLIADFEQYVQTVPLGGLGLP